MKNVQKGVEKGGSVPLLGAIISHSLMKDLILQKEISMLKLF